jgi:uncharacterized protein (UPF0332 family)
MNPEKADLVNLRIDLAKKTLSEVELYQVPNQLWNTAVNRLYYACFYAIIALLHNYGLDTKTHKGVLTMFGLHFIKTGKIDKESGKFFTDLFEMRQDADYEAGVEYEKEDVLPLSTIG